MQPTETEGIVNVDARIRAILAQAKPLAVEYYKLTGKPLGVTGEVAEFVAAETLGLTLVPARTVGEPMSFVRWRKKPISTL